MHAHNNSYLIPLFHFPSTAVSWCLSLGQFGAFLYKYGGKHIILYTILLCGAMLEYNKATAPRPGGKFGSWKLEPLINI